MTEEFTRWFQEFTEFDARPWQKKLAESDSCENRLIRVQTGFGKTLGVVGTWAFHRLKRNDSTWPLRLIWALPMRVLVEQTAGEIENCLRRCGLLWDGQTHSRAGKVGVHTLLGGESSEDWHLWPECPAVLVGTQDMLLSRAMNRGYGAARARWPAEFGLLSQDALWVLDEVQLMDVGLATAAQLAAFREDDSSRWLRPTYTWAMSATLQTDWMQKSPDTRGWVQSLKTFSLTSGDKSQPLWATTEKPLVTLSLDRKVWAEKILDAHQGLTGDNATTLVVVNTVKQAVQLYRELKKRTVGSAVNLSLIHSRFRGHERESWKSLFYVASTGARIIVSTQVIEAGVDLSADLLFTEVCPWSSLIQRLGRLARRGGSGTAYVIRGSKPEPGPYEQADLDNAWEALQQLPFSDGSPKTLEFFENSKPEWLARLYPYEPSALLLREEIEELFDTSPDLSGLDLDVSRYIRSGEERDLSVCWVQAARDKNGIALKPDRRRRPARKSLVAVQFLRARDWLFGKASKGHEPQRLRPGVFAWIWDYLKGEWVSPDRRDLVPGQTVLVDYKQGGYSIEFGWDPDSQETDFELIPLCKRGRQEEADTSDLSEELSEGSEQIWPWQSVPFHCQAVANEARKICEALGFASELTVLLTMVARWHDLGKAHPAFQNSIASPDRPPGLLAKASPTAWAKPMYPLDGDHRAGFRHELASVLAWFSILERHASPGHPSLLGELAEFYAAEPIEQNLKPTRLEQEVLTLTPEEFDLACFLICCHHGKLRARLQASTHDQKQFTMSHKVAIRGVMDGDVLPPTQLPLHDGEWEELPACPLNLEPASLGLSPRSGRSWSERMQGLLIKHGPFVLAFWESLIRAADVRASQDHSLRDDSLKGVIHAAV